jgi:predicted transcriptional regulator
MASERFTVRLDDEAGGWVEQMQQEHDRSRAWVIREAVALARGEPSAFGDAEGTGAHRSGPHRDGAEGTADLRERVAELEARVEALEGDETLGDSEEPHAAADRVGVGDDLPQTVDVEEARDVVGAALNVIDEEGPLERSELVDALGDDHSLGYDMSNRDGAWWKRIVAPGIKTNGAEHKPGRGWSR